MYRLGDWVFGCDVCQEICPWNLRWEERADRGGRTPADHPDLRLPEHRAELDLAGLLGLGEDSPSSVGGDSQVPEPTAAERRRIRRSWAQLILRIYEVDPLVCRECGSEMKILSRWPPGR